MTVKYDPRDGHNLSRSQSVLWITDSVLSGHAASDVDDSGNVRLAGRLAEES